MSGELDLDFRLGQGGFALEVRQSLPVQGLTAIFGPSGAGKSTLLRAIAGFERTGGRISFAGDVWEDGRRFLAPHLRRVGYVFQEPRLFAHLDVSGNLAYAARRAGAGALANVATTAARFDLGGLMTRRPHQLSGGEAQRVALARAVLGRPRLLVMDEPVSALDAGRRAEIFPLIEALRDRDGIGILYVSHALSEVVRLAGHVLTLVGGRVAGFGPAAQVIAEGGAAFGGIDTACLIEADHAGDEADGLARLVFSGGTLLVPAQGLSRAGKVRILVQARDVMIARAAPTGLSALNVLAVRVVAITDLGPAECEVRLDCAGWVLRARVTRRSVQALALAEGGHCHAVLKSVALARG